jgi:aryl-alcohol dehydrogenase-like predicted oxidoreductase
MNPQATPEATAEWAERVAQQQKLPDSAFRPLGGTGLTTSALGFGAYRVDARNEGHRAALRQALRRGVNLIDTSSNYSDGRSETLIGEVLKEQAEEDAGLCARTILVSKVGYVQGENMKLAQERMEAGRPFPEMVEYDPSCWHCIHPDFIADQLERSLDRLGVSATDVYLLHNPEYFFSDRLKRHPDDDPAEGREAFYGRVAEAFRFLERCIAEGRIQWYGVSSNTFGHEAEHPEFVSLERLIALGGAAAEAERGQETRSGFAVVQCPLNLLESGPLLARNQQEGGRTFLETAAQAGLGVLLNRPLNAIRGGRLTRLADVPVPRPKVEEEIEVALDALLVEEQTFAGLFRPIIRAALPDDAGPLTPFEWSAPVRNAYPRMKLREQWNLALETQIYPHLEGAARFVTQNLPDKRQRQDFTRWFPAYCRKLEAVAGFISEWLGRADYDRSRSLHERLEPLLEGRLRGLPLSQKALLPLLSLPGVSCVLNGMRRPSYVEDSTGALAMPPLAAAEAKTILQAFRSEAG